MAENIIQLPLAQAIKPRFLNYALSVITDRALVNVLDGLKPVQRRILFAMYNLNLKADKHTMKAARIVGDTMGRYHCHGDSSIYGAMVTVTQDFNCRYPLIQGQGEIYKK